MNPGASRDESARPVTGCRDHGRSCIHRDPGVYPNFPDPDLQDWAHAYYGGSYDRLLRVQARSDPGNFFRFHQSLPMRAPAR
jgi:hypothetical protein